MARVPAALAALALLNLLTGAAVEAARETIHSGAKRAILQSAGTCMTNTDCRNTANYYCDNVFDASVAGTCTHKGGNNALCFDNIMCSNGKCDVYIAGFIGFCHCAGCNGCFPGDALTTVLDGGRLLKKKMSALAIGDKVQVVDSSGKLTFDDVWFFAHRDAEVASAHVHLELANGAALRLTGDHFVPVGASWAARVMKRAREVLPGDFVHTVEGADVAKRQVSNVTLDINTGLFNPLTATGTIVVDGVVASVQSSFVFDGFMDKLGMTTLIPALYQALFAPGYWLYCAIGAENTIALERALDLTNLLHENQWLWTSILASSAAVALGAATLVGKKASAMARRA